MIARRLLGRVGPQTLITLAHRLAPNREFLIYQGQRLTRRAVFARVAALAAGLQALGIGKGDRVATLLPACPEAIYALFLPWMLGSVEVPLNPLYREHELRHILADCGARAVLTTASWAGQDYIAMLNALRSDLPELRYVIVREDGAGDGQSVLSLAEVIERAGPLRPVKVSRHEVGRISYTSGTTGLPKGVAHTRDGYWNLAHPAAGWRLDLRLLRCLLLPFPPYHYAGWLGIVATLLAGGKVVLMDRFDPQYMLECIQRERVSQVGGSPTMYRLLLATAGQASYDFSSVQRLTLGTEPCPPELAEALFTRFGCPVENMYGMTETGIISWTSDEDSWQRAATTVGRPAPASEVRIVDGERRPLPPGEMGEVAVRTAQMMLGYWRDPVLTAQVLDGEGWFYTGDLGYLGDDGYLHLVDRKKDLVIRGGQNIYPAEVERYLEGHPAVRRAGVVGVPSRVGGEALWAYLELVPGAAVARRELLDYCRGHIAPYKIPEQVRTVEHLPVTATGKVQKFRLRAMALAEGQHGEE